MRRTQPVKIYQMLFRGFHKYKSVLFTVVLGGAGALGVFWIGSEHAEFPKSWPKPRHKMLKTDSAWFNFGRVLFYDTHLSRDQKISCASCHQSATAFAHVDHRLSHGIDDQVGTRNAPALFNLLWFKSFMWDGSAKTLIDQIQIPISHPAEMDFSLSQIIRYVQTDSLYTVHLQRTGLTSEKLSKFHVLKALEHFVSHLISANSKYDRVLSGQTNFNSDETSGYHLYKTYCASCHTEPLMTRGDFAQNFLPLNPALNDSGKFKLTRKPEDLMQFKIPSLRNLSFSFPYMHDGRFQSLREVLRHYRTGLGKNVYKNKIRPYTLEEEDRLLAFLLCLNDTFFVRQPVYKVPKSIIFRGK